MHKKLQARFFVPFLPSIPRAHFSAFGSGYLANQDPKSPIDRRSPKVEKKGLKPPLQHPFRARSRLFQIQAYPPSPRRRLLSEKGVRVKYGMNRELRERGAIGLESKVQKFFFFARKCSSVFEGVSIGTLACARHFRLLGLFLAKNLLLTATIPKVCCYLFIQECVIRVICE